MRYTVGIFALGSIKGWSGHGIVVRILQALIGECPLVLSRFPTGGKV